MRVKDIASALETWAPKSLQEDYDNSGLLVGSSEQHVSKALISLDTTEAVVDEAISQGAEMIISHHPLIFRGLKRIGTSHWVERTVTKAIKHDIALYAIHTNLDHVRSGVNRKIADRLGLENQRILLPKTNTLRKLVTFVPKAALETVREALFEGGVGTIGNYDRCSFVSAGEGSFRPLEEAQPTVGSINQDEKTSELRIEVILPKEHTAQVLENLRNAHPYEEVAYYLSDLENQNQDVGAGMLGELPYPMEPSEFLTLLKEGMSLDLVRHTQWTKPKVGRIAVCGGAGGFLLTQAMRSQADVLVTSDIKYHEFFEANDQIVLADIGHYESEVYTKELILDYLKEKFTNIAFHLSGVRTNPVHYS